MALDMKLLNVQRLLCMLHTFAAIVGPRTPDNPLCLPLILPFASTPLPQITLRRPM